MAAKPRYSQSHHKGIEIFAMDPQVANGAALNRTIKELKFKTLDIDKNAIGSQSHHKGIEIKLILSAPSAK